MKNGVSQFPEASSEIPQTSRILLYEAIMVSGGYY
jgi:hypothetical protein